MCPTVVFGLVFIDLWLLVISERDTRYVVVSVCEQCFLELLSEDFFSMETVSPFDSFLLLIRMYTTRFNTPPMFENVVTKWNTDCGTSSPVMTQTPNSAIAHHCTKNAATNIDIARAALWDARMVADIFPNECFTSSHCWCIRYHVST